MAPRTTTLGEGIAPAEQLKLEGDLSARQGKNDFGKIGYGGPAPPKGKPHRYFFKVYALDTALDGRRYGEMFDFVAIVAASAAPSPREKANKSDTPKTRLCLDAT